MNRFKDRLTVDSLILTLACFVFATSVYFLFNDGSFFDHDYANAKAVGTFKTSTNDVRRRLDAGMTWSNVDAPEKVYEGDSVFTGDRSEASITLENGTIIKVAAKSLVVIRTKNGKTQLDLQYGSLHGTIANAKDTIVISQDGQSQELSGTSGSEINIVKVAKAKSVAVHVTKGEVKVPSAGKATVVKKDEVVKISETEKPVVTKTQVVLISPIDGAMKWLALGAPLNFSWRSDAKQKLRVEFSRDRQFSAPFYSAEVDGDHHAVSDSNLPDGTFFWRVKTATGDSSLAAQVTTYADLPPMPVLPKDEQTYILDTDKGETSKTVFFTWEDKSGSTEYQLDIASDKDFKSIVKSQRGKDRVSRVANLPKGDYYWRLTGRHPVRENPPTSRLMSFSVRDGKRAPTAPVLQAKDLNYMIPPGILSRFPASAAGSGRGVKPENMSPLKWAPSENASSYEVEVALDPAFTNSVRNENGPALAFAPQEVRPGSLYMRVRAKSDDGRVSPPSETAKLDVSLPAPRFEKVKPVVQTFKSPKDLAKAQHEFQLTWTTQPFADRYELQWGSDVAFTKSKNFTAKDGEHVMKVSKPMDYAARVRSLDANGRPISPFSLVEVVSYRKQMYVEAKKPEPVKPRVPAAIAKPERIAGMVQTIPAPHLKEPAASIALVSIEDAPTFVSFKWQSFKNAKYYTIQIAEDADFTKVVAESKATKPTYVFQKALPEGKVFWRVRAHTAQGFSPWSDPSDINVIYQ